MKKLVFTAIAMIAFSGVSMANTTEAKEEVVSVKQAVSVEEITTAVEDDGIRSPCDAGWIQAYENAGGGKRGWDAGDAWASSHNC
ncbi:hypothetical protein IA01_01655 [Flavobacterium psychrophilum]|uniref:Uncharacterized protein n=1 Tax=Flavobacterium psychrophilum (strain ATCC 49511 / DSM 21280 / CIP 103535 / JIP02/86) TaxID=402612 RepID=A6GWH2_FLAPJ|nr:hypothetical protein [Flavobacterium psychrophilum]AIG29250.1 hypothetical protein IA03_01600 [Flavobacterium psychrophilum]AIG31527.1 hypothetical protein IA01_01655 [Flavobacterium psychrophilum]AIG33682.1 hypothetical protein IA02_01020 [Flavobacterium psychrophilum]AIG36043.1 hypothetical protein IA04_01545 [Flavobacterium psychrophilum]AIG38309.1 hypothetical protein IA05_01600 [Flavobacterium psychrophilum]